MRTFLVASLALILLPTLAEARPRHHAPPRVVAGPRVQIVVSPWVYGYRPAARPGWVWVEGYYAPDGAWIPGYWRPAAARPGYDWVPGYWEGDRYVEGYWREVARPGFYWVEGHYERGRWIPGYWEPVQAPPPPEPPPAAPAVHHDYE